MHGRVCMITGGSSGIGKETALGLARMGAAVIVVGRAQGRCAAATAEIKTRSGNPRVEFMLADLSSQASIRRLGAEFVARGQPLHVLVNNAGGLYSQRATTVDGIETTFAVNHLAYFLLTHLLLETLTTSGQEDATARIVNVSSEAQRVGHIDFDDLQGARRYRAFRAYSQSKLANVMLTYELARKLEGKPVTANCLHPGTIASGFGRNNSGGFGLLFRLLAPFLRTPEAGARTSIYLASSAEIEGVSGGYFIDCKPALSSAESYDMAASRRLWRISAQLTDTGTA